MRRRIHNVDEERRPLLGPLGLSKSSHQKVRVSLLFASRSGLHLSETGCDEGASSTLRMRLPFLQRVLREAGEGSWEPG